MKNSVVTSQETRRRKDKEGSDLLFCSIDVNFEFSTKKTVCHL